MKAKITVYYKFEKGGTRRRRVIPIPEELLPRDYKRFVFERAREMCGMPETYYYKNVDDEHCLFNNSDQDSGYRFKYELLS